VNPAQILLVAFRALLRNKLRSFLTTLGVVIGVGAVIAMTSIGAGARARVEETFEKMGSNMLVVRSGSNQAGGVRSGAGTDLTLTWEDLDAIAKEVPNIRYTAPVLSMAAQVTGDGQNWATSIQGTTPDYFAIRNWAVARGTFFSELDVARGAKVAVLGQKVVENLFGPFADPVGEIIRIGDAPFEIIGVAAEKGQSPFGTDYDDVVFVPVSTYRAKLEGGLAQFIGGSVFVAATSQGLSMEVQQGIETLLRARHRIRPLTPDDFSVRNLSDFAAAQQEGARTMNLLLAGIALVSLLVGGIGIMNIMLVSVTERTREIGLRMAVGAKARSILTQFMVEAVVLSLIGGLLGVAFGLGAASYLVASFGWPMLIQSRIVVVAMAFSALVGVGFGVYPAYKASRLDPIQALRYE
jgi:putative ABC transport system permease protein